VCGGGVAGHCEKRYEALAFSVQACTLIITFKGDTLMRYLLDELSTYEEDHRDALCPYDEENHLQHAGKNPETRSLSAAEGYQILAACEENKRVLQDLSKQLSNLSQVTNREYLSLLRPNFS
jgi:hypothetical protein